MGMVVRVSCALCVCVCCTCALGFLSVLCFVPCGICGKTGDGCVRVQCPVLRQANQRVPFSGNSIYAAYVMKHDEAFNDVNRSFIADTKPVCCPASYNKTAQIWDTVEYSMVSTVKIMFVRS